MYDRFLFVGLGGAGGSTLGYLKNNIRKWLQENGAGSDIPRGWQFLHIDTPLVPDINPRLSEDEYLGLIQPGVQFSDVQMMLDSDINLHDEIQTWRVDSLGLSPSIRMVNGRFRAVGQTIAIAYSKRIRNQIEQSISRLSSSQAKAEIAEVYSSVTGTLAGTQSPLRVIVVSSLCGATGAGLLQTVCDIVRALETDAQGDIFGVLYTPEVFSSLGGASTGDVQPNSLAAICELLNGYWWNGAASTKTRRVLVDPKESAALIRAGLPQALTRSGPSHPFLVGRTNTSGIEYETPDQVFAATGQLLTSLVTNLHLQKEFLAYQFHGRAITAMSHFMGRGTLVDEGEDWEKGAPVFWSAGSARLSTGADYFETYAARRLVREALVEVAAAWADRETVGMFSEQLGLDEEDLGVVPPQHEFTLIAPDEYPTLFESMLDRSDSADLAEELRETIRELAQREDPSGESPPDPADSLRAGIRGLEDRAGQWLHRPGTIFGDYLATSLRSYLGSLGLMDSGRTSQKEYNKRIKRFFAQWDAAMGAAEPLINLDAGLMPTVHPDNDLEPRRSFSQLPFSGHPIESQIKVKLSASGVTDSVIENLFSTDDSIKHVDITTFLNAPHSVLVIESLLGPIAQSWSDYVARGLTQTFWSRRRARPMSEFIPAPQALISCMVRGWFTGLLLGLIDRGDGTSAVQIARADNRPAEFPFPYLSPESGHLDRLPLILEALGLAYVQVSQEGHLEPLSAYCELRDLGRSVPGGGLYIYESLHPALEEWIADGSVKGAITDPVLDPSGDATERIDELLDVIKSNRDQYLQDMDRERLKWERVPSSLSGPPQWTGLWRVISEELRKIHDAVEDHHDPQPFYANVRI